MEVINACLWCGVHYVRRKWCSWLNELKCLSRRSREGSQQTRTSLSLSLSLSLSHTHTHTHTEQVLSGRSWSIGLNRSESPNRLDCLFSSERESRVRMKLLDRPKVKVGLSQIQKVKKVTNFRPVLIFVLLTWNWFVRTNFRTFKGLKTTWWRRNRGPQSKRKFSYVYVNISTVRKFVTLPWVRLMRERLLGCSFLVNCLLNVWMIRVGCFMSGFRNGVLHAARAFADCFWCHLKLLTSTGTPTHACFTDAHDIAPRCRTAATGMFSDYDLSCWEFYGHCSGSPSTGVLRKFTESILPFSFTFSNRLCLLQAIYVF